ncbi:hypothetical protein [Methanobrevibacter sp.]|uniref:hypothetical protein n=1 Tax=Methanobrevibacter sp. TaxID=66852 RepID=UPI0025DE3784|nr:hypothetical protein [Methanobrevibacter sp.]MBQ2666878.1 hypothetical protein [Methanobrevibacter sp.]
MEISDTCENLTLSEKELSTSQVIQEESEDNMLLSNNYSSIICGNLDKVYGNDTNFTFYFYDNSRNGCAVVLSGIDFNYNAYIHTTNPILGLEFNGTKPMMPTYAKQYHHYC